MKRVKKMVAMATVMTMVFNVVMPIGVFAKENTYPFIYKRYCHDEEIYVLLNPSDSSQNCIVQTPDIAHGEIIYSIYCMDGKIETDEKRGESHITMPPCSAVFIKSN